MTQVSDPEVSRTKFDREIAEFVALRAEYQEQGWFLVEASFPVVYLLGASAATSPFTLAFGLAVDFTSYDAAPPSVRFINPFTRVPYTNAECPVRLQRMVEGDQFSIPGPPGMDQVLVRNDTTQDLLQAHGPEEVPFLCIPGVREYHEHPGHSGDAWDLYRADGHGKLANILDTIARYGLKPISGLSVQMTSRVSLSYGSPPS